MNALTRKALADVTRRKGRTLLAVLGIMLGALSLTAVNQASDTLSGAFAYTTDTRAVPDMTFTVDHLPLSVSGAIQHLPNVANMRARTTYMTLWSAAGQSQPINIEIDSDEPPRGEPLGDFQITSGRLPGAGEIVMDSGTEALVPVALGDQVVVGGLEGQPVSLRVVGLARTRGLAIWHSPALAIAYMRADALQRLMLPTHGPTINQFPRGVQLLIKTRDPSKVQQTYQQVSQILMEAQLQIAPGVSRFHYTSFDADTQLGVVGLLAIIRLLAALSLLLVCALIFNVVTALISEQIKIIGAMKALGGVRRRILRSYLLTVSIYSVMGTALGVGAGLLLGYAVAVRLAGTVQIAQAGGISLPIDPGPFQVALLTPLIGAGVGLFVPPLAALWPLLVGTRITVREAISAYGVKVGDQIHLTAWGSWLRWIPQTVWLGLRGLLRRRSRAALTLLTLALTGATFLAVQMTNDSLRANLAYLSDPFQSDFRLDLAQSVSDTQPTTPVIAALQRLPNVERVEPIDPALVTTSSRELELYGLAANTQLYHPQLVAGRWLLASDSAALALNDYAAARLHLQVGDAITLTLNAQPTRLRIVGIVHDVSDVSGSANPYGRLGSAFTTLDYLNQLRNSPAGAAERLWLRARDRSPSALRRLQGQIQQVFSALGLADATATSLQQDFTQGSAIQVTIYLLFDVTAILVALLGLLGLSHSLLTSVRERRLEIGILRAIGATGWRVGLVFGTEALGQAALAAMLAALVGVPASLGILSLLGVYFGPVDLSFQPESLATMLTLLLAVACLASAAPAFTAARTRIRAALRYE